MSEDKKNISSGTAALIGTVIGAAAGAAVIALSDKKTRKKVEDAATRLQKQGSKTLEDLKKMAKEFLEETEEEVEKEKVKTKKRLPKVAES